MGPEKISGVQYQIFSITNQIVLPGMAKLAGIRRRWKGRSEFLLSQNRAFLWSLF
jgi:hypothetical protein